jgi:hypothetical protein
MCVTLSKRFLYLCKQSQIHKDWCSHQRKDPSTGIFALTQLIFTRISCFVDYIKVICSSSCFQGTNKYENENGVKVSTGIK